MSTVRAGTVDIGTVTGTAVCSGTYFNWETEDGGTLLIWTNTIGITSVVDSTGAQWPFRLVAISGGMWCFAIPLSGTGANGFSTAYWTVNFAAAVSGWYAWVQGTPYMPPLPAQQVSVPNPAAGADWSYVVPFPARVISISAQLETSATTADRWPYIIGLLGPANSYPQYILATPTALTAGAGWHIQGWPGGPEAPNTSGDAIGIMRFSIPALVLPAGAGVSSVTPGLQVTDQWSAVNLELAPA